MIVIGLTGGVGMGKSTSAEFLAQSGLPVIDTDALARQVVEPGQPALEEIRQQFGPEVIDSAGRLRRDEMAKRVFADDAQRNKLEAILHPRIRDRWLQQVDLWRTEGRRASVVVIPLLFETSAQSNFTATICVACSATAQQQRLLKRGWSSQQVTQRIHAQWSIEKKMLLADFVIWTDGDLDNHAQQCRRILAALGFQ